MDYSTLTPAHGIKVSPGFRCSVHDCCHAVGDLIGDFSVKSASRMNGGVVMFVESVEKANQVVESGIVINDTFVSVTPLVTPAAGVTVSNTPRPSGMTQAKQVAGEEENPPVTKRTHLRRVGVVPPPSGRLISDSHMFTHDALNTC
ncbi:hypothetical protein F2P81_025348 [Scophthalmus maximus]|uniref:Uncharacterized protein n=1 Tax=Scophthalmus maximus TaxID=52904 RepID=A0A6A4RQ81_SCOMX|nr:hypothetical protein F2P81_025348 [Scophthalmus maximus]